MIEINTHTKRGGHAEAWLEARGWDHEDAQLMMHSKLSATYQRGAVELVINIPVQIVILDIPDADWLKITRAIKAGRALEAYKRRRHKGC